MAVLHFTAWLALALSASGAAIEKRATCSSYTIISTRGTFEPQGNSMAFSTINNNILAQVPGGTVYNTVYPAAIDQQSGAGTTDIINKISSTLSSNPNACIFLEGYSQGAAATINAMPSITGNAFNAVKGVLLFGDPFHKAGLSSNVDNNGGTTTSGAVGISAYQGVSIPSNWVSKTLDVCIKGDGICDTANGFGINLQHLQYFWDTPAQSLGTKYGVSKLK